MPSYVWSPSTAAFTAIVATTTVVKAPESTTRASEFRSFTRVIVARPSALPRGPRTASVDSVRDRDPRDGRRPPPAPAARMASRTRRRGHALAPACRRGPLRDRCTQYAASIAYRVLFSLFPLTIFLVSIFGLILQDDELREDVIEELVDFLPVSEEGQADIEQSIEGLASPLSAIGLISLVALLWGASGMMASIRLGLEAAMKVDRGRPAVHAKLVDLFLVVIAGLLVLLVVAISAFGAFFGGLVNRLTAWMGIEAPSGVLVRDGVQLLLLGILALLLYRFVPARRLRRQGAIAGAVVTAVGSGARRRSWRSSSRTSRATTSSTGRSPA